jgi:hypothetical protein
MKGLFRSALLLLGLVTSSAPAHAYCRLRACDATDPEARCRADADGCGTTGPALAWPSACVGLSVQLNGSKRRGIDHEDLAPAVRRAFSRWADASCGNGAPSIGFEEFEPVPCATSEFNPKASNVNVVFFQDDEWPYVGAVDVYAITLVRFNPRTGAITDADIEINSADHRVKLDVDDDGVDLESILTHEAGHFIGLDHTGADHGDATMRAGWDGTGTALRSLTDDDVDGVCSAYPADRDLEVTSCEPHGGFSPECLVDQPPRSAPGSTSPPSGSCGVVRHSQGDSASRAWLPTLTMLGALFVLTQRRSRRRL